MPLFPEGTYPYRGIALASLGMLVIHVVAGWAWCPIGASVGAYVAGRRGPLIGATGGFIAWSVLAAWSWSVDPAAAREMTRVVASLLGGLPPAATVLATLVLGTVLGSAGGWIGQAARNLAGAVRR